MRLWLAEGGSERKLTADLLFRSVGGVVRRIDVVVLLEEEEEEDCEREKCWR
jgi:hypothetical protein